MLVDCLQADSLDLRSSEKKTEKKISVERDSLVPHLFLKIRIDNNSGELKTLTSDFRKSKRLSDPLITPSKSLTNK